MTCNDKIGYFSVATPVETSAYDDTHEALEDLAIRLGIKAEAAIKAPDKVVDENGEAIEWACKGDCKDKGKKGICSLSVEVPMWAASLEVVRHKKKSYFRYRINQASGGKEVSVKIRCTCVTAKDIKTSVSVSEIKKEEAKTPAKKKVKKKTISPKAKKTSRQLKKS